MRDLILPRGPEFERFIANQSLADRREMRMFLRFARLWPRFKKRMLQSPKWRAYLAVSDQEAWLMLKELSRR